MPYTEAEVNNALNQISEGKSPGPDGMTMEFYRHNWDIINKDLTKVVLGILNNGESVRHINKTDIVLIPKKSNCQTPMDYRPISLCNVCYKIVSKMIVNRLKPVFPHIISNSQSAFIQGRSIFDNIIIAQEVTHSMKNKRTGHIGFVSAKLDMAKAYDRLEWNFACTIMNAMGFPKLIIDSIMDCITTVTFSVLINGNRTDEFKPCRGVRQGDPLSSFLFIIAAEGMCALFDDAARRKKIQGFKVASTAPAITHLCFADDSVLFFRAIESDYKEVAHVLKTYEEASGQLVNLEKSGIWFSRNTSHDAKMLARQHLKINNVINSGNYLGLPLFLSLSNRQNFQGVMDKIQKKKFIIGTIGIFLKRAKKLCSSP